MNGNDKNSVAQQRKSATADRVVRGLSPVTELLGPILFCQDSEVDGDAMSGSIKVNVPLVDRIAWGYGFFRVTIGQAGLGVGLAGNPDGHQACLGGEVDAFLMLDTVPVR